MTRPPDILDVIVLGLLWVMVALSFTGPRNTAAFAIGCTIGSVVSMVRA